MNVQTYQMKKAYFNIYQFLLTLIILFSLFAFSANGQQNNANNRIVSKYDSLQQSRLSDKLYVHLDKTIYFDQDTMWFKAYLFDETLNSASTKSGLIWFELIDSKGVISKTICLPTGNGLTWGGLALNEKVYPPGKYHFRAYTNWMQNFGERYFFKKEITIVGQPVESESTSSKLSSLKSPKTTSPISSTSKILNDIDLQFLPEGGTWLADRLQNMAFKALLPNGKGLKIEGEIIDSKQNKVASFSSNDKGMGVFKMAPKYDENYRVVLKNISISKNIDFPKAVQVGTALQVINSLKSDSIHIRIHSNLNNQDLKVIGISRGIACFVSAISSNSPLSSFKIKKDVFPTGVSQIVIFDKNWSPINERSFFINHLDQLNIEYSTSKNTYATRDSIPIEIKVTDADSKPIIGSFSMAITDDSQVEADLNSRGSILTYLLLNSDIKGDIDDPGIYFTDFDEEKHRDLDALLLTQAWASYPINKPLDVKFKPELDFTITGRISNIMNKGTTNAKLSLLGQGNQLIARTTDANEKGEFTFDKLPSLDKSWFVIKALNAKEKKGTVGIELNEFKPAPFLIKNKSTVDYNLVVDSISQNMINLQTPATAKTKGILLKEVTIKGKRVIKDSKNLNGPGESDLTITEDELIPIAKKTLLQVLYEKIPRFNTKVAPRTIDREFFVSSNLAKFIIDGVDLDFGYTPMGDMRDEHYNHIKGYLDYFRAEDIVGIEMMQGLGKTTAYHQEYVESGMSYNHPIRPGEFRTYIVITTQTGAGPYLKKSANMFIYRPPTYGDLKVFYSPKYTLKNKTNPTHDVRSTIYWVPNLITDEKGVAKTSFYSSDRKGKYTIWIEGSDMKGNLGYKTTQLEIK